MKPNNAYGLDRITVIVKHGPEDTKSYLVETSPYKDETLIEEIQGQLKYGTTASGRDLPKDVLATATAYEDGSFTCIGFAEDARGEIHRSLREAMEDMRSCLDGNAKIGETVDKIASDTAHVILLDGRTPGDLKIKTGSHEDIDQLITFQVAGGVGLAIRCGLVNEDKNLVTLPPCRGRVPEAYVTNFNTAMAARFRTTLRKEMVRQLPELEQTFAKVMANLAKHRAALGVEHDAPANKGTSDFDPNV